MPVGDPIQTVREYSRVGHCARQIHCLLIIAASACIITPRPEETEVNQALPFCMLIMCCTCTLQTMLIVIQRLPKLSQCFKCVAACVIDGGIWCEPAMLSGL